MFIRNWKKEILTVPNLLSLFRLALIPVYVYIYLNATENYQYTVAGSIMTVSCLTDMVDGKIARQFNMVSNVGKLLDPLADKMTQLALTVCLSLKYPALYPVLALLLVKECFQLWSTFYHLRRGQVLPGALTAGKICTTVLFVSLIALVLFPDLDSRLVGLIAGADGAFLLYSFVSYCFAYYGKNNKLEDFHPE